MPVKDKQPPKEYPAGRRWGTSLERRRWEEEQAEAQAPKESDESLRERAILYRERLFQRTFRGILSRPLRHRLMRDAIKRPVGQAPAFLRRPSDPSNPKGQPKPHRRAR